MVELERKELRGHSAISPTTIYGWPAVLFSLPFVGVGIIIVLVALDIIHVNDAKFNASREIVGCIGGLFALAGLSLLVHGLSSLAAQRKKVFLDQQFPGEAWHADHPWNPQGIKSDTLKKVQAGFYANLGMTIFCVPSPLWGDTLFC